MSFKDLLAVLAMIVPSLLLLAVITFALFQSTDVETAPSGAGFVQGSAGTEKAHEVRDASMRAKPRTVTQKLMRDPWQKPIYAKTSKAPDEAPCDPCVGEKKAPCF